MVERLGELSQEHIVLRTSDYLVVSKPSGWPTQGTPDKRRDHLYAAVQRWARREFGSRAYVGLHHRLDRDTSGLVLFTLRKEANVWASHLFQQRQISKHYRCLVRPPAAPFTPPSRVENHLKKSKTKRKSGPKSGLMRMIATSSGGDFAATEFLLLEERSQCLLLEARPETGRMHQIRVHCESFAAPIWGDPLYGGPRAPRLMLHAFKLIFPDPTGVMVEVQSPLPGDMLAFWDSFLKSP